MRHIVASGAMGEYGAKAPNETAAGRGKNRRVEVKVLVNKGITGAQPEYRCFWSGRLSGLGGAYSLPIKQFSRRASRGACGNGMASVRWVPHFSVARGPPSGETVVM